MIPSVRHLTTLMLLAVVLLPASARARLVGRQTAETVAANRLTHHVLEFGAWAGESAPEILTTEIVRSGDTVVGYNFLISPKGHILVPADDGLPPIKLQSEESTLSFGVDGEGDEDDSRTELRAWVTDSLFHAVKGLEGFDAPLAQVDTDILEPREKLWELYMTDPPIFPEAIEDFGNQGAVLGTGPLLKTAWSQDAPYNSYNPKDRNRCVTRTGQAPMAMAQAMRHFKYPETGKGEHTYVWKDDGRTVTLRRNFAESRYFWDYMPASGSSSSSEEEQTALAGLALDTEVALSTQFGCENTRASILQAAPALQGHFDYIGAKLISRGDFASDTEWVRTLNKEFEAGSPILYEMQSSDEELLSAAADGYRTAPDMIHLNIALDRNYRGWLAPDHLLLGDSNPADARNHRAVIGMKRPVLGPVPLTPLPGATVHNATLLLEFREPPNNDFTHYNIWIKSPKGPIVDDWAVKEDICTETGCSVIPSRDLPEPGEYQWAVRGYKDEEGSVPGPWSEPAGIIAKAPGTPVLLSPAGNLSAAPVRFRWGTVNGSFGYALELFAANSSYPEIMIDAARACVNKTCAADLDNLGKGNYSWTVRALGIGQGAPAQEVPFRVLNDPAGNRTGTANETEGPPPAGPPPPTQLTPEQGETVAQARPIFSWTPVPEAASYKLNIVGPFGMVERPMWLSADDTCTPKLCASEINATLDPDGNYTWSVQARNTTAAGTPSPEISFFVETGREPGARFTAAPPETATMEPVSRPETNATSAVRTKPVQPEAGPKSKPAAPAETQPEKDRSGTEQPAAPPAAQPAKQQEQTSKTPLIRPKDVETPSLIKERPKKILNIRKKGPDAPEGNNSKKPLLRITS